MNMNMWTLDRKFKLRVSRNVMRNIQKSGYARLFFAALNMHTKQLSGVCRITFAASTLGGRLLWKICLAKCPHIINPRLVWTKCCAEYLRLCFNGFADSILRMVVYNCKYLVDTFCFLLVEYIMISVWNQRCISPQFNRSLPTSLATPHRIRCVFITFA